MVVEKIDRAAQGPVFGAPALVFRSIVPLFSQVLFQSISRDVSIYEIFISFGIYKKDILKQNIFNRWTRITRWEKNL